MHPLHRSEIDCVLQVDKFEMLQQNNMLKPVVSYRTTKERKLDDVRQAIKYLAELIIGHFRPFKVDVFNMVDPIVTNDFMKKSVRRDGFVKGALGPTQPMIIPSRTMPCHDAKVRNHTGRRHCVVLAVVIHLPA